VAELKDILASGDIDELVVGEQLGLSAADSAEFEGAYLRVGAGGIVYYYQMPDTDTTWIDTDNTDIALTTTENSVLSTTPDQDVTTADGSYTVEGKLANTAPQDRVVTISVYVAGVFANSMDVNVARNDLDRIFLVSGNLANDIPSGSLVEVRFVVDVTGSVTLKGTETLTKATLTKAAAR